MITLPERCLKAVMDAAEAAYPQEACGLLVGRVAAGGAVTVTGTAASDNLATDPRHRFELDPALRLRLQREGRGRGETVVGLYHSHPDGAAAPSPTDLAGAWEPDLVWLIVAVSRGQAIQGAAYRLVADGSRFAELPIRTEDWPAAPARVPPPGMLDDMGRLSGDGEDPQP